VPLSATGATGTPVAIWKVTPLQGRGPGPLPWTASAQDHLHWQQLKPWACCLQTGPCCKQDKTIPITLACYHDTYWSWASAVFLRLCSKLRWLSESEHLLPEQLCLSRDTNHHYLTPGQLARNCPGEWSGTDSANSATDMILFIFLSDNYSLNIYE
jgi:hypothetical protein